MNVAIINTYSNAGGAANAALRLHTALLSVDGINSNYLVRDKGRGSSKKTKVILFSRWEKVIRYIDSFLQRTYIDRNRTAISTTLFSSPYTGINITRDAFVRNADIINFHWVDKFVSLKVLRKIVQMNKPIVWTLHDEKAYTGGCHYTAGCNGFLTNCSNCQQLVYDPFGLPSKTLEKKKEILKKANLTIVATSNWHYERIKQSALFKNTRVELIPNSLDVEKYAPMEKREAKRRLGIADNVITLQFGAHNVKDIRKGYLYLLEAIQHCLKNKDFKKLCDEKKIIILRLGNVSDKDDVIPIEAMKLGLIRDDEKMVDIYNATDMFILPSLEDNLPYTMIESMSCGTPVVGFNTGGVPDAVDSQCGILVRPKDSKKLAESIIELVFNSDKREAMGRNSRKKVVENYSYNIQSGNYIKLYKSILSNNSN